jgi:hypothetical protein
MDRRDAPAHEDQPDGNTLTGDEPTGPLRSADSSRP